MVVPTDPHPLFPNFRRGSVWRRQERWRGHRLVCRTALLLALGVGLTACDRDTTSKSAPVGSAKKHGPAPLRHVHIVDRPLRPDELHGFRPLPAAFTKTGEPPPDELVDLGRMLFFDGRFSKNDDVPCNRCHSLENYGVDSLPKSIGHRGQHGTRNAPTVYNAAGQRYQFWDGRKDTVEQQALVPVLNPVEMAMPDEKRVLDVIRSIPEYKKRFTAAFPEQKEPITYDNFGNAIGAFERILTTPSKWDDFLAGDESKLDDAEKKGLLTFIQVGCPECHTGSLVGGMLFEKLGRVRPWPNQSDKGRGGLENQKGADMTFKVASLRNVAKTGPYFHDASSTELPDAVRRMAFHQLGVELEPDQIDSIVTFLKTLTGQIPKDKIAEPKLPKSTKTTPKPDPS